MGWLVLHLFVLLFPIYVQQSWNNNDVQLRLNYVSGDFSLAVRGVTWFESSPLIIRVGDEYHSPVPSSCSLHCQKLTLVAIRNETTGTKPGVARTVVFEYVTAKAVRFHAIIRMHESVPAISFQQYFPDGATGLQVGTTLNDVSELSTAFPRFDRHKGKLPALGYLTFRYFWDMGMTGIGLEGLQKSGLYGGMPLAFFDRASSAPNTYTMVMSAANEFKTLFQARPKVASTDLSCGLQGRLKKVPPKYSAETILVFGKGIQNTLLQWGNILLDKYGKHRPTITADILLQKVGYWTDTGGVYWYHTESNKTYAKTMEDIKKYHVSAKIPVNYYELDSWWYYKWKDGTGESGGIKLWSPRKDVFPSGFPPILHDLNTPIAAHSKYYSPDNEYQKMFPFIVEQQAAIPTDINFWNYIMSEAGTEYHLSTFEHDWLASVFELMEEPSWDVVTMRNLHIHWGSMAASTGLTMLYCMPVVSDVMASLYNPAVKYIRLTDDYSTNIRQWRIGRPSILSWSIGLLSFKDTFWTTQHMPSSPYKGFTELNPELNAAVASLSMAPVAIGDQIGYTNRTLLMFTCMMDGTLLRTSKPATAIDRTFLVDKPPTGDVWHTYSMISVEFVMYGKVTALVPFGFHYVFAANLSEPFQFDIEKDVFCPDCVSVIPSELEYMSKELHDPQKLMPIRSSFTIPSCKGDKSGKVPFFLYVLSPKLPFEWYFLGEKDKFVSVSTQRVPKLYTDQNSFVASVMGVKGESVTLMVNNVAAGVEIWSAICDFTSELVMKFVCGVQTRSCKCDPSSHHLDT